VTDQTSTRPVPASPPRELSVAEAAFSVPAADLAFQTTAEIAVTPDWVGQERALAALELGLRVDHAGYNIRTFKTATGRARSICRPARASSYGATSWISSKI
jgi:hypothetical protein